MDATTLRYFDDELRHLRDVAWEFAQEHEKIGSRLALDRNGCGDPYVERLLEGFAFLAARIQRKLDDEFPSFTSHLLEMVYPDYLAPTPSMVVAALKPDQRAANLADGFRVDRDTRLMSRLGASEETRCTFLTKHPVELWPIDLAEARYITGSSLARHGVGGRRDVKAALHLRLQTFGEAPFQQLALDQLPLYLTGSEGLGLRLYEAIIGHGVGVVAQPAAETPAWQQHLPRSAIGTWGFEDELALLPCSLRSFHGYRLLKEFFSFAERFLFARLGGLAPAVRRCEDPRLDLFVLLDSVSPGLEGAITAEQIALFATPAVNLFPRAAEPILIKPHERDLHVVVDRTHDLDYEVHRLRRVRAFGDNVEREFAPFYEITDRRPGDRGFYTLERRPRLISTEQRRHGGPRSSYLGSEVFLTLTDPAGPEPSQLQRLTVDAMCSNRDLPLHMPLGVGVSHFTADSGAPLEKITCIAGPTAPRPSLARDRTSWQLINHLALNYRSIVDDGNGGGAAALRTLLALYQQAPAGRSETESIVRVASRPVVRRLPVSGPITFGRGLEVEVEIEEQSLRDPKAFLLGAVLEQFFARYVSLNSFTETVVTTLERGEIMRWPTRLGSRHLL
ncbi:MAG TPA: type VI secretion system baseplate subunit TssF [Geminicoccaceae bacterium]|nr:type VI secretion system baseplate subunit TssF [Geminicoccaceae bacterium]